jgi:Domain of unknown function (DUF4045)
MSWQQRPSSKDANAPRSRPLSRHTEESPSAAADTVDEERTRDQIALSLSLKDPSWFRQTADRGASSSAYRKSREDSHEDTGQSSSPLPGMSRGSNKEPRKTPISLPPKVRSRSPSQASSAPDTSSWGNRFSSVSSQSTLGGPKSSPPTKSLQRPGLQAEVFDTEQPSATSLGVPSLQRQRSQDRPASPTKGLGGFVQSAMMKRSDSVNKRWSAQAAPGLTRGNSIASYRGGLGHPGSTTSGPESPPRERNAPPQGPASSPLWKSRPSSSHSMSTALHHGKGTAHSSFQPTSPNEITSASSNPSLGHDTPLNESSSRDQGLKPSAPILHPTDVLPVSPTKTLDPKRWSPTKASWLESALARPESPKLTSPKLQTPGWMADLQKSKLSKEESEPFNSSAPSLAGASPTALMRSPPPGDYAKPSSIGGLSDVFNSGLKRESSPKKPQETFVEERRPPRPSSFTNVDTPLTSKPVSSSDHPESPGARGSSEVAEEKVNSKPTETGEAKKHFPLTTKTHTPPKTDFRANLRQRQTIPDESSSTEAEFKNVFAKLKRTGTKNYVAPDELKDNILRGKAALNLTGGPQRTKRVDEFKESIIRKKESMKAEAGLTRKGVTEPRPTDTALAISATLPEALAKRSTLNNHAKFSRASPADAAPNVIPGGNPLSVSIAASERSAVSPKDHSAPSNETAGPTELVSDIASSSYLSESQKPGAFNTRRVLSNHREDSPARHKQEMTSSPASCDKRTPTNEEMSQQSTGYRPVGKLASRLNPALVATLSHSPASRINSKNPSGRETSSSDDGARSTAEQGNVSSVGSLTHMTKARAKGPRRRLPQAAAHSRQLEEAPGKSNQINMFKETLKKTPSGSLSDDTVSQDLTTSDKNQNAAVASCALVDVINNNNDNMLQPNSPREQPILLSTAEQGVQGGELERSSNTEVKEMAKQTIASKSPNLNKVTSPATSKSVAIAANSDQRSFSLRRQMSDLPSQGEQEKMGIVIGDTSQPLDVTLRTSPTSPSSTLRPKAANSLRHDLPELRPDNEFQSTPASVRKPRVSGLGLNLEPGKVQPPKSQLTPPPEKKYTQALSSAETTEQVEDKSPSKVQERTARQQGGPEAAGLLADFFDEKLKITDKTEVDAQAVVLGRPRADSKGKVLKAQIWQINADGKKENLPPHQEHILFEGCMYLCVHSFERSPGPAATEVYLWSGDGVSEAATEDAQLFCRREARENNAKLEILRQGKEPAKFFQALGGIVITRRSKTSALYILCGRRHLGHVAFDEVDFDAASLCSGFPYLVSASFGKLYLWKGKGSGADEVGCARLIGMDLGLTGEIEEVEEGEEPASFFDSFSGPVKPQISSQLWNLRSSYDRCGPRLFRVELERSRGMSGFWTRRGSSPAKPSKASVQEIHPFCQQDLDSRCIFVLDAYFNIFV